MKGKKSKIEVKKVGISGEAPDINLILPEETNVPGPIANPMAGPVVAEISVPKEEKETERHWSAKADRQKAYFDSLPRVRILIPCESGEKPGVIEEKVVDGKKQMVVVSGAVWSKTFNGYKVIVPKGVYTEVSEAVAENIAEEYNQVQKSNARFSLDRIDTQTGRPVKEQL